MKENEMIQRYELYIESDHGYPQVESKECDSKKYGEWCKTEDVDKLESEIENLKGIIKQMDKEAYKRG